MASKSRVDSGCYHPVPSENTTPLQPTTRSACPKSSTLVLRLDTMHAVGHMAHSIDRRTRSVSVDTHDYRYATVAFEVAFRVLQCFLGRSPDSRNRRVLNRGRAKRESW